MNSKPRRFLIKTSFCELKIFWNSTVVFGHCAVLLALLLIGLLGINPTIKHGCFVIFCVYLVIMIFLLCKSASIEDITDKKKPASKPASKSVIKEEKQNNDAINTQKSKIVCSDLINFFKDFDFEPNFRFVNTLKRNSQSVENAQTYICNYFKLTDNQYKEDVQEKVKSQEFKNLISDLQSINTNNIINSRFKVYYGSQGTGKTTQALKESNNVVIVCHSAMLPSDLLEDFKFEEGKPAFKKSALWEAMENGTKITLDEINLLPFESLRFLQSILDNKTEINYKGQVIHIKDGFQIIGTMNLTVNGSVFNLPEPLVDRASELKEYKLTAEQLAGALI